MSCQDKEKKNEGNGIWGVTHTTKKGYLDLLNAMRRMGEWV